MHKTLLHEQKISDIAQKQVMAALREILSDPDRGLKLKKGFISRIKRSLSSKERGQTRNLKEFLADQGIV